MNLLVVPPDTRHIDPALTAPWRWRPVEMVVVLVSFTALYLLTRSSLLIGDGISFINFARAGDPAGLHFAEPSHFLQVPLARMIWLACLTLSIPISLDAVFLTLSLAGTLAGVVFFGAVCGELLHSRMATWSGALLFGTSLQVWTQWNGELYGMALGFMNAAVYCALRRRRIWAAALWALSVLCHAEFALAAPAFLLIEWFADAVPLRVRLSRAAAVGGVAAAITVVVLIAGSRALDKWTDGASLTAWLQRSYETRQRDIAPEFEGPRAVKGLVTAFSVGGHYVRDAATGRAPMHDAIFLAALGAGALLLLISAGLAAAAFARPPAALLALAWLLPSHVLLNWRFVPTVEKYHAAALPGLILLIVAGLTWTAGRLSPRRGRSVAIGYVAAAALLNLLGAVLPMRTLGKEVPAVAERLRQLNAADSGRTVIVSCDDPRPVVASGLPFLRIRAIWNGPPDAVRAQIVSWIEDRTREGLIPYVVGDQCLPEEWNTRWSQAPFDLMFLRGRFRLEETAIARVPIAQASTTDPFSWREGAVRRIVPLQ